MSELTAEDLVIQPGQGEETSSDMRIMVRSEKLGGHFSIMEGEVKPRHLLAPHSHAEETQHMYIIAGELQFEVGGEGGLRFTAGAGCHVLKPKNIQHCFWNVGEVTARYVETSTEDGFEKFVDSSSEGGAASMVSTGEGELGMTMYTERILTLMKENDLIGLAGVEMPSPVEMLKDPAYREMLKDPANRELMKYLAGTKVSEIFKGF